MTASRRVLLAHAPDGYDAWMVAERALAAPGGLHLHVARDDARMARFVEALGFFAPEVEVLTFPAWDCLPYDRVSPHRDILAKRIDTLSRLLAPAPQRAQGRVLVATVNALLQRVPPRDVLAKRVLTARPGQAIALETITAFFAENGYTRSETVVEAGDYALRGGILDVFPPGEDLPLRLDFFGDELESIRTFDPVTQRTVGQAEALTLKPVSEVILEPETVSRFRSAYRDRFGGSATEDPLYATVSEGRAYPGVEHWLPLFYERLESLTDYLPAEASVTLDHQAEAARDARLESVHDFYEARRSVLDAITTRAEEAGAYKPLPPEMLTLTAEEWRDALAERTVGIFHPFAAPEDGQAIIDTGARPGHNFAEARASGEAGEPFVSVRGLVREQIELGRRVLITAFTEGARQRLASLLAEQGLERQAQVASLAELKALGKATVGFATLGLESGFIAEGVFVISEQDILGERLARPQRRKRRGENVLTEVESISEGDLVVHAEHGIGRYEGLITVEAGGARHDMLKLTYAGGDRLFLPVENIDVLSRFGSEDSAAQLDKLGQGNWQARKAKVKARIKDMADELIRIAATRELRTLEPLGVTEQAYQEFAARFPYAETDDQLRAIEETLQDLNAGRPMDRLVCGDVGFGKTEVALRAAFVAAMAGKQVAIIVPTTLLARQHFKTVKERFQGLPLRIAQLSRLVNAKDAAAVKKELAAGTLDVVVGTHALLGKGITFRDLGLVIVDEEQHFGVRQKERLKELRGDVHMLTLTATPIPRTLQLALSGVRQMSLIATPPVDRLAVRTFVLPFDPVILREAIMREHFRGGQVFFVVPRLEDLPETEETLRKLVPEVKIATAHGQMGAGALEDVMTGFYDHKFDLLLSTHIVESGLDVPAANTIIIHRADMFGLAQLYQLRGRVGRSKLRGYAYLTLPVGRKLTANAEKRLQVMQTLDHLGAGFTLASHDLDIRGAGNLLGEEQSGHIREVGIELYQQMLEEAVANARAGGAQAEEARFTPQINVGMSVLIPEVYVPELNVRLSLYRRVADLVDRSEIEAFAAELIDRFGPLPDEVENLLQIVAIKRLCRDAGVEKVDAGPKGAVLSFHNDSFARPDALVGFIAQQPAVIKLRPDHKLVYRRQWDAPQDRLRGIRRLMDDLARIATAA